MREVKRVSNTSPQPIARHARAPKKRLWPWIVGIIIVALVVGAMVFCASLASYQASLPKALPVPAMRAVPAPQPRSSAAPSPAPVPTDIPAGQVTQIYLPSDNSALTINEPVVQMPTTCKPTILPPETGPDKLRVFQCGDYAMAGTNSSGNVVLAGHASRLFEYNGAVFNKLRAQVVDSTNPGSVLIGHEVWIHTTTSSNNWLAYRIQTVVVPNKGALASDRAVWANTPGRLILITCLSQKDLYSAVQNVIVIAQFEGVRAAS